MKRTIWLAFGFLIVVGALAALKIGVAMPSQQAASFSDNVIGADMSQDVLAKADRLDVSYIEDVPDKKAVQTTKIIPPKTATDETERNPQENITKLVSRHWHERYAKMTKPSVLKRHHATKRKS
jgi:hypothetical protein